MKYLHASIDDLVDHLKRYCLVLTEIGISEPWISEIGIETLHRYHAASDKLWGDAPSSFVIAGDDVSQHTQLKRAVAEIEGTETGSFILVGYHDGGTISVSHRTLPFQQNARPADWWKPW